MLFVVSRWALTHFHTDIISKRMPFWKTLKKVKENAIPWCCLAEWTLEKNYCCWLLKLWAKVIHHLFLCSGFETDHRKVYQNTLNFASWLGFFVWTGVVWRSPIICDHVYVQSKSLWSTAVSWSFTYRESFLFLPLTACSYVRGKISCFGLNWYLIISMNVLRAQKKPVLINPIIKF